MSRSVPISPSANLDRLLIAIPCYNEERRVADVVRRTLQVAGGLPQEADVVVFDDASMDRTRALLAEIPGVSVQSAGHNLGYAANMARIFRHAHEQGYGVLCVLDADGQHDPANIPLLLHKVQEGYQGVLASRYNSDSQFRLGVSKKTGVFLYRALLFLCGCGWASDPTSGNFALSRELVRLFARMSERFYLLDAARLVLMRRSGLPYCFVPGKFYYFADLKSMHDHLLWSLGSFARVVKSALRLSFARLPRCEEQSIKDPDSQPVNPS